MTSTPTNISALISRVTTELPGWEWLIRSDDERGFFANILRAGLFYEDEYVEGETIFPAWADTPEKALGAAIDAAVHRATQ